MLAQSLSGVFGTEQPAALQDRDHPLAERVQLCRKQRRHDIEAICRTCIEPILDQVSDLLRRACGHVMSTRTSKITQQLPQCRLVPPNQVDNHLGPASCGLNCLWAREVIRHKRSVQRQMRKIVTTEPT